MQRVLGSSACARHKQAWRALLAGVSTTRYSASFAADFQRQTPDCGVHCALGEFGCPFGSLRRPRQQAGRHPGLSAGLCDPPAPLVGVVREHVQVDIVHLGLVPLLLHQPGEGVALMSTCSTVCMLSLYMCYSRRILDCLAVTDTSKNASSASESCRLGFKTFSTQEARRLLNT